MKLTDAKFINSEVVVSENINKQALRESLNSDASIASLFDKIAQLDIMQPTLGEPAPEKPKQWNSKYDGMGSRNDIKRRVRELCKLGYPSEEVWNTLLHDDMLGSGVDIPAVNEVRSTDTSSGRWS
jgi:hypothetical protein